MEEIKKLVIALEEQIEIIEQHSENPADSKPLKEALAELLKTLEE